MLTQAYHHERYCQIHNNYGTYKLRLYFWGVELNLNQLRVFYETARCLNFSRAAQHLSISQPAVSAHIKQMEDLLKVRLFNKVGRKIYLTEAGKVLLSYATKIFDLEGDAEKAMIEMRDLRSGSLHLGTTKTYARFVMPGHISKFHSRYPGVAIRLSEGSSREMIQSLFHMKNELAVVASTSYPKFVTSVAFGTEEVLLVASPQHPLCGHGPVPVKELAKIPLIMREEGSGTRQVVFEMFRRKGLVPTILYEASNLEFIKELLRRGEGASFIVRAAVERELSQGILCPIDIDGTRLTMDAHITYLNTKPLSRIAHAFIDTLLSSD